MFDCCPALTILDADVLHLFEHKLFEHLRSQARTRCSKPSGLRLFRTHDMFCAVFCSCRDSTPGSMSWKIMTILNISEHDAPLLGEGGLSVMVIFLKLEEAPSLKGISVRKVDLRGVLRTPSMADVSRTRISWCRAQGGC